MNLHIDKESDLTAYEQLREQIIFLISTGELGIGQQMPSVRGLARQLRISLNTVSKVYANLVRGGWLIEHPGAHHTVVERGRSAHTSFSGTTLDDLIDHTIDLAPANGYSLQQLADHLRKRLLQQPPDHLLLVEPDPGMGEMMQQEIESVTGHRPQRCSLTAIQQNPALAIGAIFIAPVYMVEALGQLSIHRRKIVGVSYSPLDSLITAISRLSHPSMIGWVSVSGAGLKTVSGMAAPAISNRHSSHLFLLERSVPEEPGRFTLRRFKVGDYHPGDILRATERTTSPQPSSTPSNDADLDETVPASQLSCMDLLLLDSISSCFIHHRNAIRYELLSAQSLEAIKAATQSLK